MSRTVVAITGASSGIGAEFARQLAPEHDLLLIARRKERLDELAERFSREHRAGVEVLAADLSEESGLARAAEHIAGESRLALLVNNAGFGMRGRFWEAPIETQEQMHRLHVTATLRLTHAALRNMVPRDYGAIVNVASMAALVRGPSAVSYAATKSWMTAFTEGLYLELRAAHSHIVAQALCPGFTYSEFHGKIGAKEGSGAPRSFWLSAEEVVSASLDGLRRRKPIVIPGWRYQLVNAIVSKLPIGVRLAFESRIASPPRVLIQNRGRERI
ncbi:MAG: SDR family NAD(P)-dependent oxidoreductase [Bryobacteraceae bacterium]